MTTKKNQPTPRSKPIAVPRQPTAYERLNGLLHTMRCIAQYEDRLCELSHELKQEGGLSAEISDEVRGILDKVPSHEYMLDLDAVRTALVEPQQSPKLMSRKLAESSGSRKDAKVAHKRTAAPTGRKRSR